MKQRVAQAKFVMIIVHNRDGVRISLQYRKVMNNMWQSPGGKTDGELNMKAALRELEKKTGLMIELKDLKFLLNDLNYNCNIYMLKVSSNTELDFIESNKNGK